MLDSMHATDVELPCPACYYDLRGLGDGHCPECGTLFRVQDLQPEEPGLLLESWAQTASRRGLNVTLPLAIAFSPLKAFRRRCRLDRILAVSPAKVFFWTLVWYAVLLVLGVGVHYGLDKLQGLKFEFVLGGYWSYPGMFRFGSAMYLPVNIPLAWMQCLLVSLIGMAIALRSLPVQQLPRLATWLFTFTLLGGLFAIVCGLLWHRLIAPRVFVLPTGWAFRLRDVGIEVVYRVPDCVLGFVAGLAVGTVLQKRRWLIAIVSAAVLVAAFPVYFSAQSAYALSVYHPVRIFVFGPDPLPPSSSTLLLGPTFTPGAGAPVLAGRWSVRYDDTDEPAVYLTFDTNGRLVRWQCRGSSGLVANGQQHKARVAEAQDDIAAVQYRVLSRCARNDRRIVIQVRIERIYRHELSEDLFAEIPEVSEETLSGILSEEEDRVTGTSVTIRDLPGAQFQPRELRRSFVMEYVEPASPEQAIEP